MDITLAPELAKIVEQKVTDGEYDSASDVVNEALFLWLEEQQAEEEELRREIAIGLEEAERGECKSYTREELAAYFERLKTEMRTRHAEREKKDGMKPYELTKSAQADLDKIRSYIANDNETAAIRFLEKLESAFESLNDMPGQGIRCDDLSPGLLRFPVDNYLIYYQRIQNGIRIIRVRHGAQRVSRRLFKPEV